MDVTRSAAAVADGGTDTVTGTVAAAATSLTYTVTNSGSANLTVSAFTVGTQTNCTASITTNVTSPVAAAGTTSLVVSVTPTAAGAWSFTLSGANNDSDENPYNWTVSGTAIGVPTITSVTPNNGLPTGGTTITIIGTSLTGTTSVTIGGVPATSVTVVSPTRVTVVTPAGALGSSDIVLTTPVGSVTVTGGFTFTTTPSGGTVAVDPGKSSGGGGCGVGGSLGLLILPFVTFMRRRKEKNVRG
jgi:hypothetical protein